MAKNIDEKPTQQVNEPFFSVVIPSYNRAGLLPKAIASLQAQTFANWELIVVDDGSTDNTRDVVTALSKTDERVHYCYQENAERSAARNKGIAQARGRYICFLDSDDYYLPERLQQIYDYLKEKNFAEGFYYTGAQYHNENGTITYVDYTPHRDAIFDDIAMYAIGSPQVCISKICFEKFLFHPAFTVGEDTELWLRMAVEFPPIYIAHQFTFVAMNHEDRSVNLKKYNSAALQWETLQSMLHPTHSGGRISSKVRKELLSNCLFNIAKHHLYQKRRGRAAWSLVRSIVRYPASSQTKFKLNILRKLLCFESLDSLQKFVA